MNKYYVPGNIIVCHVDENILILQIRKLKLKKTKLLKVIKLVIALPLLPFWEIVMCYF